MEKLLEAILLANMSTEVKKDAKKAVNICFNKEPGLRGDVTTTIIGPLSGVYAGLCTLLPDALISMYPSNLKKQKEILDSIFKSVCTELENR